MDESLQRKQKIAQMLIDANEIKMQYIAEKQPARKVAAAEKNCAQLIAALIEEGLTYEYSETDTEDGIITIIIDDEPISCKNDDVYEFLGEMYESIMKKSYEAITGKPPVTKKTVEENANTPPMQPYAPIIIQTSDKAAQAPAPVQDYVPPKVYLNEEDEYMQLKRKHEPKKRKSKGLLKILTVLIIIGTIFVLYFYNTGFHNMVNNTWNKILSSFQQNQESVLEESNTAESIQIEEK